MPRVPPVTNATRPARLCASRAPDRGSMAVMRLWGGELAGVPTPRAHEVAGERGVRAQAAAERLEVGHLRHLLAGVRERAQRLLDGVGGLLPSLAPRRGELPVPFAGA